MKLWRSLCIPSTMLKDTYRKKKLVISNFQPLLQAENYTEINDKNVTAEVCLENFVIRF